MILTRFVGVLRVALSHNANSLSKHTIGRKHRKFATTNDNWKELDSLLKELVRPLREDDDELR